MANCNNTLTGQELLDSIGAYDASCGKKTAFIKRVLRNFYWRTMDLDDNKHIDSIAIPAGDYNFITTYPVYKIWGFYGRGSGSQFESLHQNTPWYKCDGNDVKRLVFNKGVYNLDDWQYRMDTACDNKIYIKTPCEITNGTIVYSRGPDSISTHLSNIAIKDHMLTGLEMLAEEMWATMNQDYNNTSVLRGQFDDWLKTMKEQQALATEFVNP